MVKTPEFRYLHHNPRLLSYRVNNFWLHARGVVLWHSCRSVWDSCGRSGKAGALLPRPKSGDEELLDTQTRSATLLPKHVTGKSMPRRPKHRTKGDHWAAERQFVDREELIAVYQAALREPLGTKPHVLVFHGGAGIGKSRLRKELARQLAADTAVLTATLEFDVPAHRQPDAALFFLRNTLGESGQVRFPSFDIAYAFLWQKTHPETPLRGKSGTVPRSASVKVGAVQSPFSEEGPLKESDSLLSQVVDDEGKLPLIGLVPRIAKLLKPVDREWWDRRGERELEDLPQMEPAAIVEQLPALWAADLKDNLAGDKPAKTGTVPQQVRRSCSEGLSPAFAPGATRRAVLFIDSYEKLWETGGSRQETVDRRQETEDSRQKTDEWVRDLVKLLPEVLWVISGRQKLRWEEVEADWAKALSQHLVEALADPAARQLLASCEIADTRIQDAIIKGSQGVPHYLNLAVDTFQEIKQAGERVLTEAESANAPEELFMQFIRHLDQPEVDTLQVLSASRFWNYGLFEHLVTEYQTGYPLTAYDDLSRFSFVGEGAAPETRAMHELMREALQEHQGPELRKRVHLFLHQLYAGELEGLDAKGITEKHRTALAEAFYHGTQAMSAAELWAWFDPAAEVFRKARQDRVLIPLCRQMAHALEAELGPNHADVATALWMLAGLLSDLADYDEAEQLLRRALAIAETRQGPEHPRYLKFLDLLAHVLVSRGRFDEAEVLYRRVGQLQAREPALSAADRIHSLQSLSLVLVHQRKYAEAEELSRQALAVSESEFGPDHETTADALNGLSFLLFEQYRFSEAEPHMRRALAICEEKRGANHPRTLTELSNLAIDLLQGGRYTEAEPLLRRALKLREEALGPDHDVTAVDANNLALLHRGMGRYAEAEPLHRRALATFKKKVGSDHPYSTRITCNLIDTLADLSKHAEAEQMALSLLADREEGCGPDHPETANALQAAGRAYSSQGRYTEAKDHLGRALEINTRVRGPEHPQTLVSLSWLARTEAKQGDYAEAELLYRDLLPKQERALGTEHPGVALTANCFAEMYSNSGRYAEAEPLFRRALAIREKAFGPDHKFVAEVLEGLAKVCEQTDRAAEAQQLSTRAKAIREKAEVASQKTVDSRQ